jgi:hypothetical protein
MIGMELLMIGGKAGFRFPTWKKQVFVMTADHHDQKLWERYFKPCKNKNLQLHVSKGLTQLQ